MDAIAVDGLTVRFGDVTAVDGLGFTVAAGATVALLGPNGAGKTTTIGVLTGLRSPSAGTVRVLGLDPRTPALRARVGVMPQTGGVYPGLRPLEVLRLFASYYDAPADPDALLDRVGLRARVRTPYRRLSGGEQQRLSLALALVGRPEVAFLDEPTAGIDVEGRRAVRELVAELRREGVTVLVTTHDLDEAERLADRIVIVDHGRVVADGTPAELLAADPEASTFAFSAVAGLDVTALGAAIGTGVDEVRPGEYRVRSAPAPATVAAVTTWLAERDIALGDLRAGRGRLEDLFLRLTEGER